MPDVKLGGVAVRERKVDRLKKRTPEALEQAICN